MLAELETLRSKMAEMENVIRTLTQERDELRRLLEQERSKVVELERKV